MNPQEINKKYFEKFVHPHPHFSPLLLKQLQTPEQFYHVFNSTQKPYVVYDKESFYALYPNFDIDFYKKKYLNLETSDNDVFQHYCNIGSKSGYKINPKRYKITKN